MEASAGEDMEAAGFEPAQDFNRPALSERFRGGTRDDLKP